jgi:hypothetical protein
MVRTLGQTGRWVRLLMIIALVALSAGALAAPYARERWGLSPGRGWKSMSWPKRPVSTPASPTPG